MKNLDTYTRECLDELNALDIYPNVISAWKVSRAVSFWGQCVYTGRTRTYTIKISKTLLDDNAPVKALKETILHELIHAVDGCLNHGYKWTMLVNKVNSAYGYDIRQTDGYKHKGFETDPMDAQYKYRLTCEGCGHVYRYARMCSTIKSAVAHKATCSCGSKNFKLITRV